MIEKIYFSSRTEKAKNSDLHLHHCGSEDCAPNHDWGPAIRDCYLIHYVLSGKGMFRCGSFTRELGTGDGFLIIPDHISYYRADEKQPWSYCWVGFHGVKAPSFIKQAGLSLENPVFSYTRDNRLKECIQDLVQSNPLAKGGDLKLTSLLYLFMYLLVDNALTPLPETGSEHIKETYVRKAVEYMRMNYPRNISISGVAQYVGLDRSYFYTLFKKFTEMSPQEFLVMLRMEKACELLAHTGLSVGHVSRSVGYNDPLLFSKMFRRIKGKSPVNYRSALISSPESLAR